MPRISVVDALNFDRFNSIATVIHCFQLKAMKACDGSCAGEASPLNTGASTYEGILEGDILQVYRRTADKNFRMTRYIMRLPFSFCSALI